MKRKIIWGALALLALAPWSGAVAQDDGFDLSSQRSESQEINTVPGHKVDHKGLLLNPTPQQMSVDWGKQVNIQNGFVVKDRSKAFASDVPFLTAGCGRRATSVTINFGERISKRQGVKAVSGAYTLSINNRGVNIVGYDERGAYYGLQTLKQILESPSTRGGYIPYIEINDYPDLPNRGVVEGFYGEPWSHEVRMSLIDFYGAHKMNVYIYGPKDDPYHSSPHWRDPYPADEAKKLSELIERANRARVDFVWAIHPGQDIKWNEEDYQNLVRKFEMMYDLGVRHYAIFFDDISGEGTNPHRQTELLNRLTTDFVAKKGDVSPLTVCPTDYTKLWANPTENGSLVIYGNTLQKDIKVFWTGDVVCSDLTPSTLEFINSRIKRPAYYWWNFPVTDYARHMLMLGPAYGLDTSLTSNETVGVLSNPMEHGAASQLALYGVADYAWNVSDYNPIDNWERGIEELIPEAPEAYRTFAIHNTDTETGYRRIESWESETFRLANWDSQKAEALDVEFAKVEAAANELLNVGINPILLKEIKPWLVEFEKLGQRGQKAIQLGEIFRQKGSPLFFWSQYLDNLMTPEARKAYNAHRTGTMKLQPFYEKMMSDLAFEFLKELTGEIPHDYIGISSFPNSASSLSQLMLDGKDETHYTSAMAQREGDWIGVDLRAIRTVPKVEIWQGRNSVDDVDFFDHATLQYSKDGREWHTLIPELTNTYDIVWEGETVEARYIRLLRLDSKRRNYAAVRRFEVTTQSDSRFIAPKCGSRKTAALSDLSLHSSYPLDGVVTIQIDPKATELMVLTGALRKPLLLKQIDKAGKTLHTQKVYAPFLKIKKVAPEVEKITLEGTADIYEVIAK